MKTCIFLVSLNSQKSTKSLRYNEWKPIVLENHPMSAFLDLVSFNILFLSKLTQYLNKLKSFKKVIDLIALYRVLNIYKSLILCYELKMMSPHILTITSVDSGKYVKKWNISVIKRPISLLSFNNHNIDGFHNNVVKLGR